MTNVEAGAAPLVALIMGSKSSGHYTFGACATSQFEQHVRAICGLPSGEPSLHLYGKKRASAGRKMGHILILDEDIQDADEVAETIATELDKSGATLPGGRAWT